MKTDHNTYRVIWSAEDREHPGLCAEFFLSWLIAKLEEAKDGTWKLVRDTVREMKTSGESKPTRWRKNAIAASSESGSLHVRRFLAMEVAEQAISLNRRVSAKLSS
jgi:hypothetical protein